MISNDREARQLGAHTVNLASLDVVRDVLGAAAVNLAADGESSTEDLKDGTLERLGHRAVAHGAGNLDDVVHGNGLGVLDVLLLLAVTRGLLEGLDDQGRGRRHNRDGGLTVLDGELDSHTETLLYIRKKIPSQQISPLFDDRIDGYEPSHQCSWQCLHQSSWETDPGDRSWEPAPTGRRLHHQSHAGE